MLQESGLRPPHPTPPQVKLCLPTEPQVVRVQTSANSAVRAWRPNHRSHFHPAWRLRGLCNMQLGLGMEPVSLTTHLWPPWE